MIQKVNEVLIVSELNNRHFQNLFLRLYPNLFYHILKHSKSLLYYGFVAYFCHFYYIVLSQSAFRPFSLWHKCGFYIILYIFFLCNLSVYQNSNQLYALLIIPPLCFIQKGPSVRKMECILLPRIDPAHKEL
jgi:hypothetical protein